MAKKQHLDDFLREKLDQLPNAPVAGFEKVEGKMAVKSHRGILVLMLIPVLLSGLYWITTLNESDLYPNSHPSVHRSEERVSPLAIEVPEVVITPNTDLVQPLPFQEVVSNPSLANQSEMSRQSEPQVFAAHDGGGDDLLSNNQGGVSSAGIETPVNGNRNAPGQNAEPYTEPSRFTTEDAALVEPSIQNDKNPTNATAQDEGLVKEDKDEMTMFVASSNSMSSVDQEDLEEAFKDVDVREISPWSVTLNVYPNYTFRDFSIKSGYEDMVNDRYEAIINESEKGGFAFNVGLDVRYHIGNNVFLGSGLGYIQMKVNGNYDFLIFGEPIIDDHGAIEQFKAFSKPIQINRGIVQNYNFLQIPLHVSYQPWVSKKVRLIVEGGFSYIYFLGAEGTTIDYQTLAPKDLSNETFNKNLASLDFKVGATYMISESIGVGLEPTLMYFSGSIYPEDHPVHVVPWSVGLNINLRMRLY